MDSYYAVEWESENLVCIDQDKFDFIMQVLDDAKKLLRVFSSDNIDLKQKITFKSKIVAEVLGDIYKDIVVRENDLETVTKKELENLMGQRENL